MDDKEFRGEMMLMNDISDGLREFSSKMSNQMVYDTSFQIIKQIRAVSREASKKVLENYFQPGFEEASKRLSEHATKKAIEKIRIRTVVEV